MQRLAGRRGFTLIELMVVLVILAIAAAIVIPNMGALGDVGAVAAARVVAADLQYAQDAAITYQDSVTVTFNTVSESYRLTNTSGGMINPITKADYTVNLTAQNGFRRLDIVSADFAGSQSVTFNELGSPSNAGGVRLQVGPQAYRVDVAAATGKVTVTSVGS